MNGRNRFCYRWASFTTAQLLLPKVTALSSDKYHIRDPVGASWDAIDADYVPRDAVPQLKDAGNLEILTLASVLAMYKRPVADAVGQDVANREFLDLCDTQIHSSDKKRWTPPLAKASQEG